jgi:glycosyltransferase involved in cell wall biosynthesis
MKRIAFISEHASPLATLGGIDNGGQNVYVAELAKELAENGYSVDVFTRKENLAQAVIVDWLPGIRVIHITAGPEQVIEKESLLVHMEEFSNNMLRFITRQKLHYDLVHAHFFMSALVASSLKKTLHLPYVVTFHALGLVRKAYQQEADKFPPERCLIERFIVRDADRLIAECPQDRDDLIRYYDAEPEKISIVPCGFTPREFKPFDQKEARSRLGLPENGRILLQLGRMVPRKGVDTVIRALELLTYQTEKVWLVIVGGNSDEPDPSLTPEIGRLQEVAKAAQVSDQVLFTGRKNRELLRYYYAAADIFITTPWYEPFGITPLEAMACGIPVIGSDTGGIKYSVAHGRTGFLVPPKMPMTLAAKIDHLLTDNKLAGQMGRHGLRRVQKLFTWEKVAKQMTEVYQQVDTALRRERITRHKAFAMDALDLPFKSAGTLLRQPFFPVFNSPGS